MTAKYLKLLWHRSVCPLKPEIAVSSIGLSLKSLLFLAVFEAETHIKQRTMILNLVYSISWLAFFRYNLNFTLEGVFNSCDHGIHVYRIYIFPVFRDFSRVLHVFRIFSTGPQVKSRITSL